MRPVGPLVSKITRPRPPGGLVARSRLVDRLGSSDAPVWWLAAPAGAGKTTLLLQALAKSPTDVAWLTVDPADDDPVRFWGHVAAALDPDTAEPLLDLLDPADLQPAIDAVLLAIEQRDRPLRLVLDDLHELSDPSTLEALGRLLLRPPPNLTVVVVTRTALRLPLARLRAAGAVVEITEDDLAFDVAEVAALFDGTLSATTVESLLERTGGWATALGLLAVSAGPARTTDDLLASLVGERTAIADYLAGEVLRALPSAVHDFLVQTSIVGADLAPALCDALTGRDDSLAVLRELTRTLRFTQQLDTASDDPGAATFRYHPVLRGVLLAEFATLPSDEQRRLHRAATAWFRAEGLPSGAVRHAMAAGDDAAALELIVEHAGPYARRGRLATVLDWLSRYGLDRCRTNPDLQPMAAWALLNARRYDELDAWLTIDDTTPDDVAAHLVTVATHLARHRGDLGPCRRLDRCLHQRRSRVLPRIEVEDARHPADRGRRHAPVGRNRPVQGPQERARTAEALADVHGQRAPEDRFDRVGHLQPEGARARSFVAVLACAAELLDAVAGHRRPVPRHELDEHEGEPENVGPGPDQRVIAAELLRGGVVRGHEQDAGPGHALLARAPQLRQVEVEDPDRHPGLDRVPAHEEVARLDVSVHQAQLMRRGDHLEGRGHQVQDFAGGPAEAPALGVEQCLERVALEPFQNDAGDLDAVLERHPAAAQRSDQPVVGPGQSRHIPADPDERVPKVVLKTFGKLGQAGVALDRGPLSVAIAARLVHVAQRAGVDEANRSPGSAKCLANEAERIGVLHRRQCTPGAFALRRLAHPWGTKRCILRDRLAPAYARSHEEGPTNEHRTLRVEHL